MYSIPTCTTLDTLANPDQDQVEYEVAVTTQPFVDTIPCPPPDWEELELE
jgi:hypothetical protein